jgi:hypothetical protein
MEIAKKIGSRYLDGLVIAEWDTHKEGIFPADDHVIKRLCVKAVGAGRTEPLHDDIELVGAVEVEVVSIEEGEDKGEVYFPVEVYRIPFPYDVKLRKQLLRLMRGQPKMFVA